MLSQTFNTIVELPDYSHIIEYNDPIVYPYIVYDPRLNYTTYYSLSTNPQGHYSP